MTATPAHRHQLQGARIAAPERRSSEQVDVTIANLSILKTNKAKAARFSTLEAICRTLDCQPGDILEYVGEGE